MASSCNMTYVRLGKSGLKVSRVVLGCMTYGTNKFFPWVLNEEESIEHIKAAYDMGINAFDTAPNYSNGLSEVILGKAIKKYNLPRDEIVVMTKFFVGFNRDPYAAGFLLGSEEELDSRRYTNQYGNSRKSVKHSLERLQLDYVDLLQCARIDPNTPIEETMQAMHDVVKAGYARYIGMSSCYAWQLLKMQNYAKTHGLTESISMSNYHNAVYREEEREMVPLLQDIGVGMIPWSPLAREFLAHPVDGEDKSYREKTDQFIARSAGDHGSTKDAVQTINKRVFDIANKHGVSMAQVAVAWSLAKPFVSAPIVGTTSLEKLKDVCNAVHLKLSEEEVKYIDEPYVARAIFAH